MIKVYFDKFKNMVGSKKVGKYSNQLNHYITNLSEILANFVSEHNTIYQNGSEIFIQNVTTSKK